MGVAEAVAHRGENGHDATEAWLVLAFLMPRAEISGERTIQRGDEVGKVESAGGVLDVVQGGGGLRSAHRTSEKWPESEPRSLACLS
jgi:hypothetical protein